MRTFKKHWLTSSALVLSAFFSSYAVSDQSSSILDNKVSMREVQAASYSQSPQKKRSHKYYSDKRARKANAKKDKDWKPYLAESNSIQPSSSLFFQSNIGVGLIYLKNIRGNLMGAPRSLFTNNWNTAPVARPFTYNRTPLFEFVLGYRFFKYFKLGLNYQHQANITVQTPLLSAGTSTPLDTMILSSNLELDAIGIKGYVDLPWPVMMKNIMINHYFGSSIGLGWQSWSNIEVLRTVIGDFYQSSIQPIRGKYPTNLVWTLDAGWRIQGINRLEHLSVVAGCKFTLWGNSGNLGKQSQQDSVAWGLEQPLNIRKIHQWAPYLGVQWNFPEFYYLPKKARIQDDISNILTEMNVGVGTLKFNKVRGNLISKPARNEILNISYTSAWIDLPVTKLRYNPTPLFEYLVMHRFNRWLKLGVSYQNQAGITVQSPMKTDQGTGLSGDYGQFTSSLTLNALMVKGFAQFPDIYIANTVNLVPYLGFGFGPSWQTWSRTTVLRTFSATGGVLGGYQPIRQKISANCSVNLDGGLRLASANPNYKFSFLVGCKYNLWGQARNIGLDTQQGTYKLALHRPVTVKRVTQWAPYMGVQWTFPSAYHGKKPYYLEGYSPKTWKPFFISIDSIERSKGFYTQFTVGVGLLYFSGVKGNLAEEPNAYFFHLTKDAPIKGRLSYNRTPLYEYLLGYQVNSWIKAGLSYQHQGNVSVQTQPLTTSSEDLNLPLVGGVFTNKRAQFSSDLVLDALMIKGFLEYPRPMVWRNVVFSPYYGMGAGIAWQTWKRNSLTVPFVLLGLFDSSSLPIRQKVSFNGAFNFDFGVRMQSPLPDTGFSVTTGLKFNLWGQARQMGNPQQGYTPRFGLFGPVSIKSVYQWAPYLGVQWNF